MEFSYLKADTYIFLHFTLHYLHPSFSLLLRCTLHVADFVTSCQSVSCQLPAFVHAPYADKMWAPLKKHSSKSFLYHCYVKSEKSVLVHFLCVDIMFSCWTVLSQTCICRKQQNVSLQCQSIHPQHIVYSTVCSSVQSSFLMHVYISTSLELLFWNRVIRKFTYSLLTLLND